MKGLGVGCFWFQLKCYDEENFDPKIFLERIRDALSQIDSISDIDIIGDGDHLFHQLKDDRRDDYLLQINDAIVTFEVFIPERVQNNYLHGWSVPGQEKFQVEIVLDHPMPTAFVSYDIDPLQIDEQTPARAVAIVREHLKNKLSDSNIVEFKYLGPSPFHVNFFVDKIDDINDLEFKDLSDPDDGYGRVLIQTPRDNDTPEMYYILKHLNSSFSSYYDIINRTNLSNRASSEFLNDSLSLLENGKDDHWFNAIFSRSTNGKEVDRLLRVMIENKIYDLQDNDRRFEYINRGEFSKIPPADPYFKEVISHKNQTPWDDLTDIIKLIEERRQKLISNLSSVVSGVLGGLIGAVVGSVLTFNFTESNPGPSRDKGIQIDHHPKAPDRIGDRCDHCAIAAPPNLKRSPGLDKGAD